MGPIFVLSSWRGNFHLNNLIFWANGFYYAVSKEKAVQHKFMYVYPPLLTGGTPKDSGGADDGAAVRF